MSLATACREGGETTERTDESGGTYQYKPDAPASACIGRINKCTHSLARRACIGQVRFQLLIALALVPLRLIWTQFRERLSNPAPSAGKRVRSQLAARKRRSILGSYWRVLPQLWPYRRALILSAFCALGISFCWAANLSATAPIVKLLFEGKNLHQYLDEKIEVAQQTIATHQEKLEDLNEQDTERRARALRKESEASYELWMLEGIRGTVMLWVPDKAFPTLVLVLCGVLIGTLLKGIFVYWEDTLVGQAINLVIVDIRKACFRHTLSLDYQTIAMQGTSQLMSKLVNDVEVLGLGLQALLVRLIREPLKAGGCILFSFCINWRLTLLAMIVLPVMGFVFHRFGQSLKRASHGTLEGMSAISKCLNESFDSIKAIIAFGSGRRHRRQFHYANKLYNKKSNKVLRVASLTRQLTELMGVTAVMMAVFPGAYLVLNQTDKFLGIKLSNGPMDSAQLAVLYALLAGTLDSIRKMSAMNRELRRGSAACDRIVQILDAQSRVPESAHPVLLPRHSSEICFKDITFNYHQVATEHGLRPPALENVNLTVKVGEVVAVIGENGSGKSTLINLLPRFYDPEHGSVRIDGIDIRDVTSRDLRSQIGLVTQETLLFDDTILHNIRYGKPDATREEIEDAARRAHVLPFVSQLPDGFDTQIGEKGMKLSGGQRQRIALARAIIRDPAILILDEATSAIDSQSEQIIHQVLKTFVQGRTVFIITHVINDTFLDLVTRIVVMENGKVGAAGTHQELLATNATYQRLYHGNAKSRAA